MHFFEYMLLVIADSKMSLVIAEKQMCVSKNPCFLSLLVIIALGIPTHVVCEQKAKTFMSS